MHPYRRIARILTGIKKLASVIEHSNSIHHEYKHSHPFEDAHIILWYQVGVGMREALD